MTVKLSEIGIGVKFWTTITERSGKKLMDYSFRQSGTWVELGPSRNPKYRYKKDKISVHDMLVEV